MQVSIGFRGQTAKSVHGEPMVSLSNHEPRTTNHEPRTDKPATRSGLTDFQTIKRPPVRSVCRGNGLSRYAKISTMAQQRENPIYWDQSATKWNLTLIFSAVVAVLGLFMQAVLLNILGLGMAIYSWLTTPASSCFTAIRW